MGDKISYRIATSSDLDGIMGVFTEVAPEVPTRVFPGTIDTIQGYVSKDTCFVAVNSTNAVIGYALAEMAGDEISLVYVGVAKEARGIGVCTTLIGKLKDQGFPIVTDVRADNQSSMVDVFEHLDFMKLEDQGPFQGRTKLRWQNS